MIIDGHTLQISTFLWMFRVLARTFKCLKTLYCKLPGTWYHRGGFALVAVRQSAWQHRSQHHSCWISQAYFLTKPFPNLDHRTKGGPQGRTSKKAPTGIQTQSSQPLKFPPHRHPFKRLRRRQEERVSGLWAQLENAILSATSYFAICLFQFVWRSRQKHPILPTMDESQIGSHWLPQLHLPKGQMWTSKHVKKTEKRENKGWNGNYTRSECRYKRLSKNTSVVQVWHNFAYSSVFFLIFQSWKAVTHMIFRLQWVKWCPPLVFLLLKKPTNLTVNQPTWQLRGFSKLMAAGVRPHPTLTHHWNGKWHRKFQSLAIDHKLISEKFNSGHL